MAKSKSYGGLIFLLVVLGAGGYGIWYYFGAKTEKPHEFTTVKVAPGNITQAVTATGDLQPVQTVDVSSQISGQVKDVFVDFNSPVKVGQILANIDPSTYEQRLRQAQADLTSAEASNKLVTVNTERTRGLFKKNLVSQQELDSAEAQFAQSASTLVTRTAALENAKVDLERCTIKSPIDGIVLDRKTDKGRTVAASLNAPVLFTLVNDLSKMQIQAAVAEADVGSISEGQKVNFTVDAFPNMTFRGTVRQVRNAATIQQSVVSYATIIDVTNEDLKLKPGMTANVSIVVSERNGVLRVANSALRVRLPAELQPKPPAAAPGEKAAPVAAALSDEDRRRLTGEVMKEAGMTMGTPPAPEMVEKAKELAKAKGLDPEVITRMAARMASGGGGGGPSGGGSGGKGGRRSSGQGGGGGSMGGGTTNAPVSRPVYKLIETSPLDKKIEVVQAKLGVSDGFYTEILDGLKDGDVLVTGVITPGAAPITQAPGSTSNPFQGGGSRFGGSSRGGGGR